MDGEFTPFLEDLLHRDIAGKTTSAHEHVPEVERQIRVIKERVRGLYYSLPYTTIPKVMMETLVHYVVSWLNNFPPKGGISNTVSPRTLFSGVVLDFNKHCKLEFGEYCHVHKKNNPTNSIEPRITGTVAIGSTYNLQTGTKFLSLNSGRLIYHCAFAPVPLTQYAKASRLYFIDRHGVINADDEEEENNDAEFPGMDQ